METQSGDIRVRKYIRLTIGTIAIEIVTYLAMRVTDLYVPNSPIARLSDVAFLISEPMASWIGFGAGVYLVLVLKQKYLWGLVGIVGNATAFLLYISWAVWLV